MSIEKLQEKIRKTKNPSVVDLTVMPSQIPPKFLEKENNSVNAGGIYCKELLYALKGIVPAVRFSYGWFSLCGADGLLILQDLMKEAQKCGYYVLLDCLNSDSPVMAEFAADKFADFPCDGLIVPAYAGSDVLDPYAKRLKESGKSLFVMIRNANKSASQLQDLVTGSRLVHMAAADIVKRLGESMIGRSGYSQIAGVCAATSADSIRTLRSKYKNLFLLLDGYDYPGANAKNCSFAFDKLGHGAVACAGESIVGAWKEHGNEECMDCIISAAERMKKNLTRYVTVL